uniref:Allene oxide synthase n=1 Tax=Oryza glumipatula TaxID=40148 RepID=A0A0D9YL75_9ORYZ
MVPSFPQPASAAAATRPIPGSYGPPLLGPLRDRLDYFWFQGPDDFFRRRAADHKSTVFRANIPPTFPFFLGVDPRVVAVVDAAAFTALFDPYLVDKRDVLIGPYVPSLAFTRGTRVGVYLDTQDPDHARTKAFSIDLLRRASRNWAAELRAAVDDMLAAVEEDLNRAPDPAAASASYLIPLQKCIFRFLCKALVGADPAADGLVDRFGVYILDVWLALQLVPTQKVGVIPQPLEELLLHSFPLPSFVVKPGYDLLYRFVEKHGAAAVSIAEKEHGISKEEAINNILFVLGFNAFGGFSVFLPFLVMEVGKPGRDDLRRRLREEVRRVLGGGDGGEAGFAAVREMALVRSTVYEVGKGELLCGYQPLAMRDPAVFERPEEFVPERFLGYDGEALLQYVYWSNGPETGEPSPGNKQCAAKEVVVATACMLVAELFRRYDDFECDGTSFTKLDKRELS